MRNLFWLTFLFAIAAALAVFAQFNSSNVVVFYPPYRVELSLNLFVVLLLLAYLALYAVSQTLVNIGRMPGRAASYRRQMRARRAQAALRDALESLFAGRFARAERSAREAQISDDNAETAALIGARAAHQMHEYGRRDAWLAQIRSPERQQVRQVTAAELQLDARDADGAIRTVRDLQASGARHIHLRRIALRASQQLRDWAEVLRLVRSLEKRSALHPVAAAQLRFNACEGLLEDLRHDGDKLLAFWKSLSAAERADPRLVDLAAKLLLACGRHAEARSIIEQGLAASWDSRLVQRYGACVGDASGSALPLIQQAEAWLGQRPADASLHFALGCLCLHQQLWGKAQASLENCLRYADDAGLKSRAHLALARLCETLDRDEEAAGHFRACALLAAD